MPNWCMTEYCVKGKSSQIKKLDDLFRKIEKENLSGDNKQGFGNSWLGNLLIGVGYSFDEVCKRINYKNCEVRCRGWLEYFDDFDDEDFEEGGDDMEYCFSVESAWYRPTGLFEVIKDKLNIDAKFYYCSEETGCEVFETNDDTWSIYPENVYKTEFCDGDVYKHRYLRFFETNQCDVGFALDEKGNLRLASYDGSEFDCWYNGYKDINFLSKPVSEDISLEEKEKIWKIIEDFNNTVKEKDDIENFINLYGIEAVS